MSADRIVNAPVSLWQRAGLFGLIAAFMTLGILRLNDCDLFNPDSPRYVIYSQAIVQLGDYRAIDVPGSPLYTWRPPGLSLLIAPMMALRPYDVVAAKLVVLMLAALLLWIMFSFSKLYCSPWSALLMTAVLASGPTFLVLSTEVLSEIPYTLAVLTVLFILCSSTTANQTPTPEHFDPSRRRAGWFDFIPALIAIIVMAFTPWLRTAGVSLVIAVGLWSLLSVQRLKWLSVAVAGVTGLGLLAWRNHLAGGENYVGSLFGRLRDKGPLTVMFSGLETVAYYLSMLPGLLLPGFSGERTWYAPLALDDLPRIGLSSNVAALVTAILVLLALSGMYRNAHRGGLLALLYVAVYGGCLIVWPWRHERFLWPLFPVFWAFVPAGFFSLTPSTKTFTGALVGLAPILGLCGLQMAACEKLAAINQEFVGDRDAFYKARVPGFYFSDWRRAGEWLRQNTPAATRVLTWHAAVGETSRRFQKRVQFETLSPEKIRQQIDSFSARYLVVPEALFGDGFGWQQLEADPNIRLNVVYREHDVVILEAEPNRDGHVSKSAYPDWLAQQIKESRAAAERLPWRTDIAVRNAGLRNEAGETEDAIKMLRDVVNRGTRTVRVCSDLGWMLFETGRYEDAARFLEQARKLPNAESIAHQLTDGVQRALERIREKTAPGSRTSVERSLSRVKSLMNSLKYAAAEIEADRLIKLAPDHAEVLTVRGILHHRLGEIPQAIECYERAIQRGAREAEPWLMVIRMEEALKTGAAGHIDAGRLRERFDPATASGRQHFASVLRERGWAGRALATLEDAHARFPDDTAVQIGLAELYRAFARPDLARPLYESVLRQNPADDAATAGLKAAQQALTEPVILD